MLLPMRELNVFGMLLDPASALLVIAGILYILIRLGINRLLDLNRFVWHRPLTDIALWVILYSLCVLTLRPI